MRKSFRQGYSKKTACYRNTSKFLHAKGKFKCNIHGDLDPKKYAKGFMGVQFGLKYRLLYPAILTADLLFGKFKKTKVPKADHNYLLKRFDTAYNKAVRNWVKFYIYGGNINGKSKAYITKKTKEHSAAQLLMSAKQWFITILLYDQAYKEFFNIFTLEYAKELQKELKGKNANHLIYHSKIVDDVAYFKLIREVKENVNIGMFNQDEKKN